MGLKLFIHKDSKSPVSEIFRTLRTNIKFASFDKEIKSIVFTSVSPNEGKSTITANLAVTLCRAGSKVMLLESDLRNPTIHKIFNLQNSFGLTNILLNAGNYTEFIQESAIKGLDIITCGPKPPNPAEILGSPKMKEIISELRKDYDYILIDAPPVIAVTDAALLASICDGTILVIASGETSIDGALKARSLLQNVRANIMGTVLNKCKSTDLSSYYEHYYDETQNLR